MPTLRRGTSQTRIAAGPGRHAVLLESVSPYGSRRVVVEHDGTISAAYLHDETTAIAATWIANHGQAPPTTDLTRLSSGQAPEMPADRTKHPDGLPLLGADSLRALWLEEGDGVAILENDEPIAVLPGWSDMSKGMPGYSRDVIGQTTEIRAQISCRYRLPTHGGQSSFAESCDRKGTGSARESVRILRSEERRVG